jgi:hypothetical protein
MARIELLMSRINQTRLHSAIPRLFRDDISIIIMRGRCRARQRQDKKKKCLSHQRDEKMMGSGSSRNEAFMVSPVKFNCSLRNA